MSAETSSEIITATAKGKALEGGKEGEEKARAMGDKLIAQAMPDQTKEFSNYVKSKMPADLRNADNIALLSRELLNKGYDKDTIIKIETVKQEGVCWVKIILNNETYKGGFPADMPNAKYKALSSALKNIKPNKLKKIDKETSNKLEEFSNYVKSKMPADLRNADNIALLSRKLLASGYDKNTIIKIETAEQEGVCFVKIILNGETYKGGFPADMPNAKYKALSSALKDIG